MDDPEKKNDEDQMAEALKNISGELTNLTTMFERLIDEVTSIAGTMSAMELMIQNEKRNKKNAGLSHF